MVQKFNNKKPVLVSDFDGTISKNDFFKYATETIITKEDMEPWAEYKAGKITHINALNLIFSKIRLPRNDFNKFIDTIEIEEFFVPTVDLCKSKNIDFHIVSAGADYYISRILNNLGIFSKVNLLTNSSTYSEEKGLELIPIPISHEYYDENLGISKRRFVQKLQKEGYYVIFAGDGSPDIEAATYADMVFARDYLITLCEDSNIPYTKFDSYLDIYNYIMNC